MDIAKNKSAAQHSKVRITRPLHSSANFQTPQERSHDFPYTTRNTTSFQIFHKTLRLKRCLVPFVRTRHPSSAHIIRVQKTTLSITFYRSVQMCTHTSSAIRVLHPPSALNRSLLDF